MEELEELLIGYPPEEFAYTLHIILVTYLHSIGILNRNEYYKFLNKHFESTLKKMHKLLKEKETEANKKRMETFFENLKEEKNE